MHKFPRATTATVRSNKSSFQSFIDHEHRSSFKKDKDNEYLTPRNQIYSAQGNRSQDNNRSKKDAQIVKNYLKVQNKIPVMMSNNKQDQIKNKMNKLGLQSFMKQIVINQKLNDPLFSSRVIHALNKTYIQNDIKSTPYTFKPTLGKRSLRQSRRSQNSNIKVLWNPQINQIQQQFKQLNTYIPNTMFPCRKQQTTKLLKNRYKRKQKQQRQKQSTISNTRNSQQKYLLRNDRNSYSMNLNLKNKNFDLLRFNSFQKKSKNGFIFNSPTILHGQNKNINSSRNHNEKNNNTKDQSQETLFNCKKVKIYV